MNKNFDEITDIAIEYSKKAGYSWVKILKVTPKEKIWEVEMDVGVLSKEIKKMTIEDSTGRILSYG